MLIEVIIQFELSFLIPRKRTGQVLLSLLRYKGVLIADQAAIEHALALYVESSLSFSACLLQAKVQLYGYSTITKESLPEIPALSIVALPEQLCVGLEVKAAVEAVEAKAEVEIEAAQS